MITETLPDFIYQRFFKAGIFVVLTVGCTWSAHRHALTVGFVSMMILGVSSRIVPMLAGLRNDEVGALWGLFLLLNVGNAFRVGLQMLTDFVPWVAYPWVGFTGFIEVVALFWWGGVMWRAMNLAKTTRARLFPAPVVLEPR